MRDDIAAFIRLSSALTGYSQLQLGATAVATTYLKLLETILEPAIFRTLVEKASTLPEGNADDAHVAALLADPMLGPVLKNLILVWYTGTWNALPADWQQKYGQSTRNVTHVVSAGAYQGGLQCPAARLRL